MAENLATPPTNARTKNPVRIKYLLLNPDRIILETPVITRTKIKKVENLHPQILEILKIYAEETAKQKGF